MVPSEPQAAPGAAAQEEPSRPRSTEPWVQAAQPPLAAPQAPDAAVAPRRAESRQAFLLPGAGARPVAQAAEQQAFLPQPGLGPAGLTELSLAVVAQPELPVSPRSAELQASRAALRDEPAAPHAADARPLPSAA